MTIRGLIDKIQDEKPNTFSDEKLLSFINEIEHDAAEQLATFFEPYTEVDDTELLVPAPYDALYESYLKAKIDYALEEYPSYQLNVEQQSSDFDAFVDWVVRTGQALEHHAPRRFRNIL